MLCAQVLLELSFGTLLFSGIMTAMSCSHTHTVWCKNQQRTPHLRFSEEERQIFHSRCYGGLSRCTAERKGGRQGGGT